MIEQLKIREALDMLDADGDMCKWTNAHTQAIKDAVDRLTLLEAMVGQVLTVVECVEQPHDARAPALLMVDGPLLPIGTKLYTATPVAQQYEAGDVASAAAQGFRDGVASVEQQPHVPEADCGDIDWKAQYEHQKRRAERWIAKYEADIGPLEKAGPVAQQPQKLEDIERYRMQMAGISTAAMGYWKEGDSIHPDYDTLALRDVAKLYAKYDALYKAQQPDSITPAELAKRIERGEKWEVAQQPQARPDFTDEWTGYLKDGETPFERFLRERKDMQSVLKLYQRVLEENESLKAQQPQAEAVQQKPKLIGWRTSDYLMETSDKDKADNWAVHNEILPIFEGDPYTKLVAAPQQAEAVPGDVTDAMVDAYLKANDAYWRETDTQPKSPAKWRNGNPKEATRVSLAAAIAQQKGGV